jgi:hypothetical protein
VARRLLREQPRFERRGGGADERRERLCRRALVRDVFRLGEERVGVEAARQLAPLPVEDEAARAVGRVLRLLLAPRAIRQELVLEELQLHEAHADHEHPQGDAEDDDGRALTRAVGSESGTRVRSLRHIKKGALSCDSSWPSPECFRTSVAARWGKVLRRRAKECSGVTAQRCRTIPT